MCLWVHEYMCSCRHVQPMYINHGVQLYMTTCTCIYICPQYKIISKPSFYICAFTVVQSKFQDSYRNTILPSFCLIELQEDVENRKQNRVYPCMMVVMVNTITHTHTHTHTHKHLVASRLQLKITISYGNILLLCRQLQCLTCTFISGRHYFILLTVVWKQLRTLSDTSTSNEMELHTKYIEAEQQ